MKITISTPSSDVSYFLPCRIFARNFARYPKASKEFHHDILGLQIDHEEDGLSVFNSGWPGLEIGCSEYPDRVHLSFIVDDVDSLADELRAKGVKFVGPGDIHLDKRAIVLRRPGCAGAGSRRSISQSARLTNSHARRTYIAFNTHQYQAHQCLHTRQAWLGHWPDGAVPGGNVGGRQLEV